MNRSFWQFGLAAAYAALTLVGGVTTSSAADERRGQPADRIERLERQLNEMAQRQEQFMRRMGSQQDRQAPIAAQRLERARSMKPLRDRAALGRPMPPAGAPALAGVSAPGAPRPEPGKHLKEISDLVKLCFLVAIIFNILLAIWIFSDIRKRGEGSGVFIALALLAGVPAAIIYAIVRIGDKKA